MVKGKLSSRMRILNYRLIITILSDYRRIISQLVNDVSVVNRHCVIYQSDTFNYANSFAVNDVITSVLIVAAGIAIHQLCGTATAVKLLFGHSF